MIVEIEAELVRPATDMTLRWADQKRAERFLDDERETIQFLAQRIDRQAFRPGQDRSTVATIRFEEATQEVDAIDIVDAFERDQPEWIAAAAMDGIKQAATPDPDDHDHPNARADGGDWR